MQLEQFNQIIDAAVKKEEEAILFYKMLRSMVPFKGKDDFIGELIDMEKGHIIILEQLRKNKKQINQIKPVQNLGIAEYLVNEEPHENMDYKALLELAMRKEGHAEKFYLKMMDLFDDEAVKAVFLKLANEEAKHKNHFEKIYDDEILKDN